MTSWLRGMLRIGTFATGRPKSTADREGYFDAEGVRIHYAVYGTGEPVVLVHGNGVTEDINGRLPGLIPAFRDRRDPPKPIRQGNLHPKIFRKGQIRIATPVAIRYVTRR